MTSNDRLEKGDTILVTGATGLIGSATVNALISRGYKVRGVTRDVSKTKPLTDKIDNLYGPGKIEFVETGDYAQPDAYKAALEGTAGIVHLAVDLGALFAPDASVDAAIRSATDMTLGLLKTATKIPTMKAVVVTSSNAALYTIEYGKDLDVSLDDYNEASVTNAYAAPLDHPFRATYVYSAAKTRSEQALWKWFRETKVRPWLHRPLLTHITQPSFSLNTVIPHMVVGKPFNPAPGVYTTSTWLEQLFNGDVNSPIVGFLNPPNWTIDVNDCAVIHVAALLDRDTDGQRLWAAGNPPVHINEILNIWRDAYPNHPIPADFDFPAGSKQILDREASTALLKRYAGKDWTPLKDSLIENVKDLARA